MAWATASRKRKVEAAKPALGSRRAKIKARR
jgi:hypothetical protein